MNTNAELKNKKMIAQYDPKLHEVYFRDIAKGSQEFMIQSKTNARKLWTALTEQFTDHTDVVATRMLCIKLFGKLPLFNMLPRIK